MKYPNVQPIEKEDYEPYCKRATRQKAYPSLLKSESPKPVTRSERKADQAGQYAYEQRLPYSSIYEFRKSHNIVMRDRCVQTNIVIGKHPMKNTMLELLGKRRYAQIQKSIPCEKK